MARAFTPHAVLAPLALPWMLFAVLPGTLRKGLFIDPTRTGMVMLYRSSPVLDVLVLFPFMLAMIVAYLVLVPALVFLLLPTNWALLVFGVVTLALVSGMLFLLPRAGGSMFPWGPETPAGERWEVAGLAQLPGTRLTGIQLALRALQTVPPEGAVIVATAGTEKLFEQYQRFGFTAGPKHRVRKVVGRSVIASR